jgi:predicted enzyme related to lactoylglutathione lyase
MARAMWFEIPAADLDRAAAFYEALLGEPLERDVVDGHPAAYLPAPDGEGAAGALMHGDSYVPSLDGTRIYLGVDDVVAAIARAVAAGGTLLYPATAVGDLVVAEVGDSERNRIALSSPA